MTVGRAVRRKIRQAAAPAALLLVVSYFLWNATQGERGLDGSAQRQQDLQVAQRDLGRANDELAMWQRRINSLRTRIDTDALDERARAMLNRSDATDVVVTYDKGQKLF